MGLHVLTYEMTVMTSDCDITSCLDAQRLSPASVRSLSLSYFLLLETN